MSPGDRKLRDLVTGKPSRANLLTGKASGSCCGAPEDGLTETAASGHGAQPALGVHPEVETDSVGRAWLNTAQGMQSTHISSYKAQQGAEMTGHLGHIDLSLPGFLDTWPWRSGADMGWGLQAALLSGLNRHVTPCLGWASA